MCKFPLRQHFGHNTCSFWSLGFYTFWGTWGRAFYCYVISSLKTTTTPGGIKIGCRHRPEPRGAVGSRQEGPNHVRNVSKKASRVLKILPRTRQDVPRCVQGTSASSQGTSKNAQDGPRCFQDASQKAKDSPICFQETFQEPSGPFGRLSEPPGAARSCLEPPGAAGNRWEPWSQHDFYTFPRWSQNTAQQSPKCDTFTIFAPARTSPPGGINIVVAIGRSRREPS